MRMGVDFGLLIGSGNGNSSNGNSIFCRLKINSHQQCEQCAVFAREMILAHVVIRRYR